MLRLILLKITLAMVWIYQKTISLDHSFMRKFTTVGRCKFYPTCSEYAKGALLKYGIIAGTARTIRRLSRCNPFSSGGIDEA